MNLPEMKEPMSKIVVMVLRKYTSGEKFFAEVYNKYRYNTRYL